MTRRYPDAPVMVAKGQLLFATEHDIIYGNGLPNSAVWLDGSPADNVEKLLPDGTVIYKGQACGTPNIVINRDAKPRMVECVITMDDQFDKVEVSLLAMQKIITTLRAGNESIKGLQEVQDKLGATIGDYRQMKRDVLEQEQKWANLPRVPTPPPLS